MRDENQVVMLTVSINAYSDEWLYDPNKELVKILRKLATDLENHKGSMGSAGYIYDSTDESCGVWSLYANPEFYLW